jgi:2-amino-4-hydroxy-6-hydroxymethyldihydropteridine diphosphokinase
VTGIAPPASAWAWIALGCNVGHRGRALACLRVNLGSSGARVEAVSSEILTLPVGVTAQGDFHNQVLLLRSPEPWTARRWLGLCAAAERACGRRQTYAWGPRRADADLVLLGRLGEVLSATEPVVPHPGLATRPFWRRLVAEIDPEVAGGLPNPPPRRGVDGVSEAPPSSDRQAVGELGHEPQRVLDLSGDGLEVGGLLEVEQP